MTKGGKCHCGNTLPDVKETETPFEFCSVKCKAKALFLDYFNNFLTVERFAEYYGLTVTKARRVIRIGRNLHERGVR